MKKNNIPPGIGLILTIVMMFLNIIFINANAIDPKLDKEIEVRVQSLNTSISVRYDQEVKDRIWSMIEAHKSTSEVLLGRATMYFPLIEGILREKDMPQDLKYIAVIESGLDPQAVSRARATGMWQFMHATARHIGLSITKAVDERRDPIKSTYAAMDYLNELYETYGDWTLALAAYNCGPGNVNKAIKKANGLADYWAIQSYLPRETRSYIPKFIAMNYVMNYYYLHNIVPQAIDMEMMFTASVKVSEKIDLKELANKYEIDFDLIKHLNPSFLKNFIPESQRKHYLTLPETHLYEYVNERNAHEDLFLVSTLSSPKTQSIKTNTQTVYAAASVQPEINSVESLGSISRLKGGSKAIDIRNPRKVKFVTLERGQTLADIADEHGVELHDIIKDNNFSQDNLPKQGDKISIFE